MDMITVNTKKELNDMEKSRLGILILLVTIGSFMGSASAADVPSGSSNSDIQTILNNAAVGENINFASGATFTGIHLNCSKALNFVGNGATLVGDGSNNVLTISSSNGIKINGLTINVNGYKNGITGSNVINGVIENNTIINGGDAINIYMTYENLTINNNTINNMSTSYGDGISLVNHNTALNITSYNPSTVTNNQISDVTYGIFLGGNFKGTVSDNILTDCSAIGMNITGKKAATNGILYANITNNDISNTPLGVELENPHVQYLFFDRNIIDSDTCNVSTNSYYNYPSDRIIIVTNNEFGSSYTTAFYNSHTIWADNN
jgi:parallel beta-helix repeat protein